VLRYHPQVLELVVDPGDAVWGKCPLKRLSRLVKWRPFEINSPLSGVYRNRNRAKKYSEPKVLKVNFYVASPLWRAIGTLASHNLKIKHKNRTRIYFSLSCLVRMIQLILLETSSLIRGLVYIYIYFI